MKCLVAAAIAGILLAVGTAALASSGVKRTYEVVILQNGSKSAAKKLQKRYSGHALGVLVVETEEGKSRTYQVEKPFATKKAARNYILKNWYSWQTGNLSPHIEVDS